jgi:hypothetical protein
MCSKSLTCPVVAKRRWSSEEDGLPERAGEGSVFVKRWPDDKTRPFAEFD